ncbi:MAG TPA: hypothetical protein VIE43_18815 [Thermoanaerobaculia bacterium]|nr:hypothetical protein [Thermoanaerobaculia bacterium]
MNTYKIDVNLVDAAGSATGKAFQVSPVQMEIKPVNSSGKSEPALVTWKFQNLPGGLTPVITFDSPEVIASGPTTTLGATPQVSFEIRFPRNNQENLLRYSARYQISVSSGLAKKSEPFPAPTQEPCLVVIRTPDPPGGLYHQA